MLVRYLRPYETRVQAQGDPISQDRTGYTNSRAAGCRTILEVKKEVKQAAGFQESKGAETAGRSTTRQPAVEGQRTPGQRGSRGFQAETADGGGDTPPKPLPCPVSPGTQPGKRARERDYDGSATI